MIVLDEATSSLDIQSEKNIVDNLNRIIKINVKNKKELGSDRIANAIGAQKFKNCLILDFGTATTFDVVVKNTYYGGIIAPGVRLSLNTLSDKATLIPKIDLIFTKNSDLYF